jgi:protoporphyrin/coproporphyrin ferrochelatase
MISRIQLSSSKKTAVLLLAHGSPDSVEEIPGFLLQVTRGRAVPSEVVEEVKHRYGLIGRSPLTELTMRQGELLSAELGLPVYVGMRNWKPFIADVVQKMATEGIENAVVICLAPQNSSTSVGLYRSAVTSSGELPFTTDFVESWHDHPLLIKAFAEKLSSGWTKACREFGRKIPVIFTAHSVPLRTIADGDAYERQAKETAALVAAEASIAREDWRFAFQSQGMSGGPWLGPTVEETILVLKAQGYGGIFVQPIGFLCDHVEVLFDIDIAFKKFAEAEGMQLWRAESLNESPLLMAALANIVRSRLSNTQKSNSVFVAKS